MDQRLCKCGKPADCPLDDEKCQDCWETECDAAWWVELAGADETEGRVNDGSQQGR